jgi:hypothetical protein
MEFSFDVPILNVLIACEESQEVCKAFRAKGNNAFSNDILPCSGGHPEWHLQEDARLAATNRHWDLIISFPPCTHLAVSGARWFKKKRLSGEQDAAIKFFLDCWNISNAVENPIGIMSGSGDYIRAWFPHHWQRMQDMKFPLKPTQIIQPWQFGHGETKATCLWLNGVKPLIPTDIVSGREQRIWKMSPSEDRGKQRSVTLPGIAKAMAYQWG